MEKENQPKTIIPSKLTTLVNTINFLWILKGFSSVSKSRYIRDSFTASRKPDLWHIRAIKSISESKDYLSIYLCPDQNYSQNNIAVNCQFCILDSEYKIAISRRLTADFTRPYNTNNKKGFPNFALLSDVKQYVQNDQLKIRIIMEEELFCWNSFHKIKIEKDNPIAILANNFRSLLDDKEFCDFTINVEEQEIHVHKALLAVRSPVFSRMLKSDVGEESKDNEVYIPDFSFDIMSALVLFMYTSEVDLTDEETAQQLFLAADKYEILDLKQLCEKYLMDNFTVFNALDLLYFADAYNENMRTEILDYIANNRLLFQSLESVEVSDPHKKLLKDLILKMLN